MCKLILEAEEEIAVPSLDATELCSQRSRSHVDL